MRIECECSRPVGNKFPSCSRSTQQTEPSERASRFHLLVVVVCVRGSKSDYARKDRQPAAQDPVLPGSRYILRILELS